MSSRAWALGWGEGAEAVVWGRRKRVPAPTATFLNGFQIALRRSIDCVHEKAVLHPMATLLPAAFAYAERKGGISGRELHRRGGGRRRCGGESWVSRRARG